MALVGNILLGTGSAPAVSSIASAVASAVANSELSSRIPWNSLEYSGTVITAISGSAIGGQGGGGGDTSQCLPKSASGDFYPMTGNPSGFLTAHQDISNKLDSSAFTSYTSTALTGIQDNITALSSVVSSGPFQPTGDYAYASSLSSKLDASASGAFAPSGNYAYSSSLSGYVPKSSISAQSAVWNSASAVSAKLDTTAFTSYTATATAQGHVYNGVSPIVVDNTANLISLSATAVNMDSSLKAYNSGSNVMIGLTYPVRIVAQSSQATGTNIIYIVTGSA